MSIAIDGEKVAERWEIWSVKRKSTDGEEVEIVFEGENDARLDEKFYGGKLWVRTCYTTEGREADSEPIESLSV